MKSRSPQGRDRRASAVPTSASGRLVGLEGLRGIAAIAILIVHVTSQLGSTVDFGILGRVIGMLTQGLTLFFVLSGFLLFRPFVARFLAGRAHPSVRSYLIRRLLRIYPAYLVVLTLTGLVLGLANTRALTTGESEGDIPSVVGYITDPATFLIDMTMLQTYVPAYLKTGLGVAWTLTVELTFYLMLPGICWLLLRGGGDRWRVLRSFGPVLVLIVMGVVGRIWFEQLVVAQPGVDRYALEWADNGTAVLARSILLTGQLFAAGMAASVVVALYESGRWSASVVRRIRALAIGVSALAAVASVFGIERDNTFAIAAASLIVFLSLRDSRGHVGVAAWFLDAAPLRRAGDISYSLYLWHVPVIWLLLRLGLVLPSSPLGLLGNLVIVLVVTIAFAEVTYRVVEAPAMRFAGARTRRPLPAPAVPPQRD